MKPDHPQTMLECARKFANEQAAHDYFVALRWPNGVACPRMGCGNADVTYYAKHRRWYCKDCRGQFTAKVGTIFEDSPIGFAKWLPAMWLIASNRNGISSYEIARGVKVTQKTAWFMLHRIREAMTDEPTEPFSGPVEADEVYIGGLARKMSAARRARATITSGYGGKTTVFGMVERKGKDKPGKVRAFVVPDNTRATLTGKIRSHVKPGSELFTDSFLSYKGLHSEYLHAVVNHAVEYVRGRVHTNNIEGFWSVFKRAVKGTYICPRPQHLQRYVEEQVFRFNARHQKDGERFPVAVKGADGKRLTYKALIAKD
jgi:transposase-like protein